jgi:hypothetical protein
MGVPKCSLSKYGFRASGVRTRASAGGAETGRLPRFLSSVLNRPSQEVWRELATGERYSAVSAPGQSTGLPQKPQETCHSARLSVRRRVQLVCELAARVGFELRLRRWVEVKTCWPLVKNGRANGSGAKFPRGGILRPPTPSIDGTGGEGLPAARAPPVSQSPRPTRQAPDLVWRLRRYPCRRKGEACWPDPCLGRPRASGRGASPWQLSRCVVTRSKEMLAGGWATGIGDPTAIPEGPAPPRPSPPLGRRAICGRGEPSPINPHDVKYTIKLPAAPPVD